MERKLIGRRTSSKLPGAVDLNTARTLVYSGMIAETLKVTPRAGRRIVGELRLRDMAVWGRFRA